MSKSKFSTANKVPTKVCGQELGIGSVKLRRNYFKLTALVTLECKLM